MLATGEKMSSIILPIGGPCIAQYWSPRQKCVHWCNSGMNIMGVTNHFWIGLWGSLHRRELRLGTINLVKSLGCSWGKPTSVISLNRCIKLPSKGLCLYPRVSALLKVLIKELSFCVEWWLIQKLIIGKSDTMKWVLAPKWHIYITLPSRRLWGHRERGLPEDVSAGYWGRVLWNAVFCLGHGHCTQLHSCGLHAQDLHDTHPSTFPQWQEPGSWAPSPWLRGYCQLMVARGEGMFLSGAVTGKLPIIQQNTHNHVCVTTSN